MRKMTNKTTTTTRHWEACVVLVPRAKHATTIEKGSFLPGWGCRLGRMGELGNAMFDVEMRLIRLETIEFPAVAKA